MIVSLYKKAVIRLLLFVCLLTGKMVIGQQYPVQIVPQLMPPYTLHLSDYYNGVNEKLVVLLTNTDLRKPALQVRLRMSILGQSAKLMSRDNMYYPPIQLDAGIPNRISLADLAPYFNADNLIFQGITRAQYVQSGKLPEGFYQFCFEAIELGSNQVVGRSSCAMAWISLNDPPLLNLPVKAESIVYKDPQNIIFQWTPRNFNSPVSAFNTEYEFTLVELWDNGLAPEAAFGTAQPLYQTTTKGSTLLYGPAEPLLLAGHRYAWRIRAQMPVGTDGGDAWRNNGYSEIFWFTCQNNCAAPLNVQADIKSGKATVTWAPNPNQTAFIVDYREKGQTTTTWYSSPTTASRMMLYDLKKGKTYEYRVGGTCDNGTTYSYSDIKTLVITADNAIDSLNCGMLTAEPSIGNRTPIKMLLTGDVITAGEFPVKLTQVSGQSSFTGTGYVTVPFFGQNRVKVKFDKITVNTDKQLIGGVIETTYDSTGKQIANLDQVLDGGGHVGIVRNGIDTTGYYVDMVIPGVENIKVELNDATDNNGNSNGGGAKITITGPDGTVKAIEVKELPATIKDKNGTIYGIDKDGNVTKIGESGGTLNMKPAELNKLQPNKAVVRFVRHGQQQYAFDAWQPVYGNSNLFKEKYEKLAGDYYVSAKAIAEAKADVVKAVVDIKDTTIKADSIRFITAKGTRYESKLLSGNTWEIQLVGGPGGDAQELYALYPQDSGKYLSLGKLLIASYKPQNRKLVLVPVNGATMDKATISQQLNAIYNPVAVSFEVTQDAPFNDKSWDLNQDDKLAVAGSGWLTNLTSEMKALNLAYVKSRTVQNDAVYLFVLNGSDSSITGEMPRGKQFGYLFRDAKGRVVAHETGHGLFKLKHVFDGYGFKSGELPSNVMDYPAGESFTKYQWDALHDPGVVISYFEKPEDGQLRVSNISAFESLKNESNNTYTFLSPGGMPVTLPGTASDITISETNYFNSASAKDSLGGIQYGTLIGFSLTKDDKTERYTAFGRGNYSTFEKYKTGDGKVYVDSLSAKETTRNIIIGFPSVTASTRDKSDTSRTFRYALKATWIQGTEESWKKAQNENYMATGYLANGDSMLNRAAVACFTEPHWKRAPVYEIVGGQSYSDFEGCGDALELLADNTEDDLMPLPVLMNIANLIKLYPKEYRTFLTCVRGGKKLEPIFSYEGIPTDTKYEVLNRDGIAYLDAFKKYIETPKQDKGKLAGITDSDEMEKTLDNLCFSYGSLSAEERIHILKVLTQEANRTIAGCITGPSYTCEEHQLIAVISSIPDSKQAVTVADYLNKNMSVLLRLVNEVNDGDNHEKMMRALYDLFQKKDERNSLTAEDMLNIRLYYNKTFDYGTFAITATVNRIDFSKRTNEEPRFTIEEIRKQVFKKEVNSYLRQKYTVFLEGNGYTWINDINPLDAVTVVFGEDFKLTNGQVVFSKGDIVRMPALYLWHLYDIDAKQTAQLLRANAIKFVATVISYFNIATTATTAERLIFAFETVNEIYKEVVSPSFDRQKLNSETREVLEQFDALAEAYMWYQTGNNWLEWGKLAASFRRTYLDKIRDLHTRLPNGTDKKILSKLYDAATEFEEGKVSGVDSGAVGAPGVTDQNSGGWLLWSQYQKGIVNNEEFAIVGRLLYSKEAVELAAPARYGVPALVIEDLIKHGTWFARTEDGIAQRVYDSDGHKLRIVTEDNGRIVRTISKVDFDAMDIPFAMRHIKVRQTRHPDGTTVMRKQGIVGAHDKTEFARIRQADSTSGYKVDSNKLAKDVEEIVIISRKAHPDITGVEIIHYKIPMLDGNGPSVMIDGKPVSQGYTNGKLSSVKNGGIKTVYDPAVWTDAKLESALKEAIQDVAVREKGVILNDRGYRGRTKEGYIIEFWYRDNKIQTFYFYYDVDNI